MKPGWSLDGDRMKIDRRSTFRVITGSRERGRVVLAGPHGPGRTAGETPALPVKRNPHPRPLPSGEGKLDRSVLRGAYSPSERPSVCLSPRERPAAAG